MAETSQFLITHGLPILFAAVLLEQLGLPLPATPWLLAVGALSALGKFNAALGIGAVMLACLVADSTWFFLGRYRGARVLNLLCRISLEPDSCVRRTQNLFTRHGLRALLVAKFVPGLNTVAAPLAGMSGVALGRFLLIDAGGSFLYGGTFILLGSIFSAQIQTIADALASIGGKAFALLAGAVAVYIGFKYWQRKRLLRDLRMARITVDELRRKQEAGEKLLVLDLRSLVEQEQDPSRIPGSLSMRLDEIDRRQHELPRDRDIVLYCSCPNEETSARVALVLRRKGFTQVRPLLGGIDAWREQKLPMESRRADVPASSATVSAG